MSLLLLTLFLSIDAAAETHPRYGGRLRFYAGPRPESLDPLASGRNADMPLFALLYRTLFEYGVSNDPASPFATARRESDRWVFKPLPARAANGLPIGPEDMRRCIERGLPLASFPSHLARQMLTGGSELVSGQAAALSAFVPEPGGDGGFSLHTNGPQPLLPHVLARPPFYVTGISGGLLVPSGPFTFGVDREEGAVVLVPNPHDPEGEPYAERVRVAWKRDAGEAVVGIQTGERGGDAAQPTALSSAGATPPITLLLCLNPSRAPFSDVAIRRALLSAITPARISVSPEHGALRTRCAYLPSELGIFPAIAAMPGEEGAAIPGFTVICRSEGRLAPDAIGPAFPGGVAFSALSPAEFEARIAAGDYDAFVIEFEHRFRNAALDMMEMLYLTRLSSPDMLDASNRIAEAIRIDDRDTWNQAVISASRSVAESGILFPLGELTPRIPVDPRLRGIHLDLRWNPRIEDCWIDASAKGQ